MAGTITINGVDLRTLEFYHERIPGLLSGPEQSIREIKVPGTAGVLFSGPVTVGPRELTIQGTLLPTSATIANLDVAAKRLLAWVRSGLLRIVCTSGGGQILAIEGTYVSCEIVPKSDDRPLDRVAAEVTLKIRCREAYWRSVEPTILHLTAAATRFDVRLRGGSATPILEAIGTAGITNPTWTLRRPDGSVLKSMLLASVTLDANDYAIADCRTGRVIVSNNGAQSGTDSGWSGDFPFSFDHRECYPELGQYLTLEISAGTGRAYYWETEE